MTDQFSLERLEGVLSTIKPQDTAVDRWHRDVLFTCFSSREPDNRRIAGHAPIAPGSLEHRADHDLDEDDAVLALPHAAALGRPVIVRLRDAADAACTLLCGDLGPHNRSDRAYVLGVERPAAEAQHAAAKPYLARGLDPIRDRDRFPTAARDDKGRVVTNPAGGDLTPAALEQLGIPHAEAYSGEWSGRGDWCFEDEA